LVLYAKKNDINTHGNFFASQGLDFFQVQLKFAFGIRLYSINKSNRLFLHFLCSSGQKTIKITHWWYWWYYLFITDVSSASSKDIFSAHYTCVLFLLFFNEEHRKWVKCL